MKKLLVCAAVVGAFLTTAAFADPAEKNVTGKTYISCATGKTAKEAADSLNQFLGYNVIVSAPSVTVTAPGEITLCATVNYTTAANNNVNKS